MRKGGVVTCEIIEVKDGGLEVKIVGTELDDLHPPRRTRPRPRRPATRRFAVGEKVDARVTQFDRKAHKVAVSIKALEVAEEKEAIAQFGSADSGASLGDILGAALKARDKKGEDTARRREEGARRGPRRRGQDPDGECSRSRV